MSVSFRLLPHRHHHLAVSAPPPRPQDNTSPLLRNSSGLSRAPAGTLSQETARLHLEASPGGCPQPRPLLEASPGGRHQTKTSLHLQVSLGDRHSLMTRYQPHCLSPLKCPILIGVSFSCRILFSPSLVLSYFLLVLSFSLSVLPLSQTVLCYGSPVFSCFSSSYILS